METPKPGDYGWGKNAEGKIAFGEVRGPVKWPKGFFGSKTIPSAVWDRNAGRVIHLDHLVEWHPLEELNHGGVA